MAFILSRPQCVKNVLLYFRFVNGYIFLVPQKNISVGLIGHGTNSQQVCVWL